MGECQQRQADQLGAQAEPAKTGCGAVLAAGVLQGQHGSHPTTHAALQGAAPQPDQCPAAQQRGEQQQRLQGLLPAQGPEGLQPEAQLRKPLIGLGDQPKQRPKQQQAEKEKPAHG